MALNQRNPSNPSENQITSAREIATDREILTAYGPKKREQILFTGPGATKQSFKDECDINRIMARYQVTGVLPEQLMPGNAQYVDVTGIEYQSAMLKVADAQSLFERLPAEVRLRFKNDPSEFLTFAENPANQADMVKMGLAKGVPPPPPPGGGSPGEPAPPQASTARGAKGASALAKGTGEVPSQNLPGIPDGEK